jgi:hypothetical protein
MFVNAIKAVAEFTRPVLFISRYYGSTEIQPGLATLFFVNADGWALTCRHVVQEVAAEQAIASRRAAFEAEMVAAKGKLSRTARKKIEAKHGLAPGGVFEHRVNFGFGVSGPINWTYHLHPTYDVALLHFQGFSTTWCSAFPTFGMNGGDLQPGKTICRLGYPFPEFTNFAYDPKSDTINWTNSGSANVPPFPIDGLLSRLVLDGSKIAGFELTTPGLRGQSGGPAFDTDATIWGMQWQTCHLDLNFDVEQNVSRQGKPKKITSYPFLHAGRCVHVDVLKDFMRLHEVAFVEG